MRLFLLSLLASTGMLACTDTKVSETEEICNDGIDDDQDGSLDCDDSDCASNIACDADGDGFGAAADCDDNDPSRYPGATELCDNLDNDCNDIVDDIAEDSLEGTIYYADTDGDTFGDADASVNSCTISEGYVTNSFDCDDSSDAINPDAEEVCDNLDNNCDNEIDNNPTDPLSFYMDMDGDGFGDAAELQEACAAPEGYVDNQDDCDDANDTVYPGADEICDDLDNNCDNIIDENPIDGLTYYIDTDSDGHGSTGTTQVACAVPTGFSDLNDDCDDTNDTVYLDAYEICDGIDNDCDTLVDDADDTLLQASASNWYQDNDNDGYGNTSEKVEQCVAPAGYVEASGDCNDTDPDVSPAALEVCDSIDNDCDGVTNNKAVDGTYFYRDVDGDGYGSNAVMVACSAPTGFVANSDDCNDADASINPVAAEVCDDVDQNCSGDENDSSDAFMWYFDADGDGYGDPNMSMSSCTQPAGYVADNTDCNDTSADAIPDMSNPEVCDGVDNNCDGNIDAADPALDTSTYTTFYTDADGDGFGVDDGNPVIACLPSAGLANNTDDCDDSSADSNPDADENCNGVDNDCDGIIDNNAVDGTVYYLDLDGDGFGDPTTEELYCANNIPTGAVIDATDCDDSTDLINTNGTETCADGLDNNCDGNIDCDDSVCAASPQCGEISCTDGLDDDSDGFIDCLDSECVGTWQCTELCTDQKDNDADGLYDCEDDDCATNSNCFESDCNDFGDNDGNGLVDCEDPSCASSASCGEISCTDGVDNDGDGGTDCDDSECGAEPTCQSYCVSDDLGSAVGEGVYTGVMSSSTGTDTMLGSCNLTTGGVDVSMTWTPPQDGCYQFDTESSFQTSTSTTNTDTVLYVREGSCSGAEIGCSEDEGAGFSSIFIAEAFSDTEYVITIDGYSSFSSGNLVLDIEFLGDHCPEAICYDGLDDDNDGAVDCADQDCAGVGDCLETDCTDGIDDEGDGLIDCADPDCEGIGSCVESDCADDIDNEGDGLVDCADPECEGQAGCVELNCADLVDDDEDGLLDCDDPDCEGQVGCVELNCADLLDDDNDGLLDCDDPDCEGKVGCVEANCADGLDDDLDGDVDCADSECADDAYCETFCHDYDLGSDLGAAVYTGDTTTGADTLSPSADCSSSTGGLDSSYTWTPPSVGTYTFSVSGAAFDPILSIKTDCLGEELDCYDDAADTTGASLSMDITSTDPLTIVVDSADGGSGLFTLGIVADFEADCNDGVDNEGDGFIDCDDSDCGYQFECASPSCPNFDLESISGEGVAFGNNTNPAAVDSFQNPANGIIGCGSTSSSSPDYSYSWLAPADGCVVFDTSESTYDTVLRIMDDCNGSVLDCDDDGSVGTRSELAYPVEEGESYIIIVDGYSSSSTGDYQLDVAFTAGVDCSGAEFDCGDGTDNDGDGDIDCDDSDCAAQQICNESSCTDGVDNELDGLIDCADDDCASDPACYESDCTDGFDNDTGAADGLIDCLDPDCAMDVACYEYSCNDLADDDNDGLTDCDDPDCFGEDACIELDCFDSIDDDNDGLIDCLDDDCIDEAGCLDYCVGTGNDLGDVTGFSVATGLNGGSGDSFTPSCSISESGGEEVILSWEAPQTGHYRFSTEASDYDTVIYLLESCVGGELADACNDDADFLNGTYTSMVEGDFVAGETVTIVIDGYDENALGTYVLDIIPDFETDCSDGIDNEGDGLIDCDDSDCDLSAECACPIEDLGTQTGDGLIEATLEDALFDQFQASCTTQGGEDMTYTWEAPTTGCATVDTLSGTMDSILVAFTDCPGSGGTEIACNDDYSLSGGIYESEISFDVVAGTSYVIGVDSWSYSVADPYILDINIQANVSCP